MATDDTHPPLQSDCPNGHERQVQQHNSNEIKVKVDTCEYKRIQKYTHLSSIFVKLLLEDKQFNWISNETAFSAPKNVYVEFVIVFNQGSALFK